MPDSVLGKIAVEIGGGTAANGGGGGSPSSSSIAGGGDSETKKQLGLLGNMRDNLGKMTKNSSGEPRFWTKALKTMGIQVGLAGILKQSQIFTSTLGSLFQILGAFVDVILAPWMPLFIPMIRKLARQIPVLKKWSENVYKQVTEVYGPWIKNMFIKMKDVFVTVKDKLIAAYDYIRKPDFFSRLIKDVSSLLLETGTNIVQDMIILLKRAWNWVAGKLPEQWFGEGIRKGFGDTGETSGERRTRDEKARSDEQNRINAGAAGPPLPPGGVPGKNGGKPPPIMPPKPEEKDEGWIPRDITGVSLLDKPLNTAAEHLEDALETFANMDFAKQMGIGYGAAAAARYGATPLGAALHQAPFGSAMKKPIDIGMDALKKPHQIMNFLAKNTGKGMMAAFGKVRGVVKPQSTTSMFDDFLDEMYDPNTTKRRIPTKPKGILDFSRFRGTGDEAGRVAGDSSLLDKVKKVVQKVPKPDVGMKIRTAGKLMQQGYGKTGEFMVETGKRIPRPAAAPIRSGMEEAIKKTRDFMSWLKGIQKSGAGAGVVKTANSKLKSLWAVFHPLLDKSPALRAVPALLTRFARYLIPMAATAFIIRETEYDIKKMMALDMPWLNDPLNIGSYMAEGKTALGQGAIREGGQSYQAQIFSGLWPGGGEEQGKRMAGAVDIIKEGQKLIDENREQTLWTGQKGQIITGRTIAAMLETGGSLFGAPGVPFIAAGAGLKEQVNRQAGIGTGSGESYFEQQFMSDMKFWLGQSTQKVTIDGADGSQYTSGAET